MADDKILIEIALEDGTVLKGFKKIKKEGEDTGAALSKSFDKGLDTAAVEDFAFGFKRLAIAGAAFGAVVLGLKKTMDLVFEGENIKALNQQFDVLTRNAGVSGKAMIEAFESAADGMVDTEDIIKSANKALIQLSVGTEQLPKLFEVARKASAVFGGEVTQNFESINQAIASGNTRALKNMGLFIDSEKAIKDYARSLGVSAQALNETGRQQAILNAVMEKSKNAFDSVDLNIKKNQNQWERLKVSLGELKDTISLVFERTLGPMFEKLLGSVTKFADKSKEVLVQRFGEGADQAKSKAESLAEGIRKANEKLTELKNNGFKDDSIHITSTLNRIKMLESALGKLNGTGRAVGETMNGAFRGMGGPQSTAPSPSNVIDVNFMKEENKKVLAEQSKLHSDLLSLRIQDAEANGQFDMADGLKKAQILSQHHAQMTTLRQQFETSALQGTEEFKNLEAALIERKNMQIESLEQTSRKRIDEITKAIRMGVVNGLTNAFAALGGALAKSQNGFEAFSKAIISSLGALAIQIGSMLVATGLGWQAAGAIMPAWAVAGAGTVAAGLGLIALGGALQAMGGGGGEGAPSTAGGGGVAVGSSTADSASPTEFQNTERPEPSTNVVVNIQGNVLDRRQAGLELVEVINEAFGTQGVVLATTA